MGSSNFLFLYDTACPNVASKDRQHGHISMMGHLKKCSAVFGVVSTPGKLRRSWQKVIGAWVSFTE